MCLLLVPTHSLDFVNIRVQTLQHLWSLVHIMRPDFRRFEDFHKIVLGLSLLYRKCILRLSDKPNFVVTII